MPGAFGTTFCVSLRSRVPDACTVKRSGHETYVHLPLSQGDRHLPPVHSLSAAYPQDR